MIFSKIHSSFIVDQSMSCRTIGVYLKHINIKDYVVSRVMTLIETLISINMLGIIISSINLNINYGALKSEYLVIKLP